MKLYKYNIRIHLAVVAGISFRLGFARVDSEIIGHKVCIIL